MTAELASATPRLAIVIPIYRHSALVIEAIESVLAQRFEGGLHLVLVSDGCPMPETDQVCREYAHAYPELVSYLRKRNGGLSDARNFGIRHVLKRFPTVEAIYMLDADNRLRRDAMARAMAVLDADPEVDWVYPNIDMFGLEQAFDLSGPYSELIHSEINICEAGSLIRRKVFENGVLFDTEFKMGWEDWDFFLSAARAGFRGQNLEDFGFLYRKRPESMLADSSRSEGALASAMRQKHKRHTQPKNLLALEHAEAPRFAVHLADCAETLYCVDPSHESLEQGSFDDFEERTWRALTSPNTYRVPPINVFTNDSVFNSLKALNLLHWVLWKVESLLQSKPIVGLIITRGQNERLEVVEHPGAGRAGLHKQTVLLAMSSKLLGDILKDRETLWIDTLVKPVCDPPVTALELRLPTSTPVFSQAQRPTAAFEVLSLVHRLRSSPWREAAFHSWGHRSRAIPWRGGEQDIVRKRIADAPAFPRVSDGRKHIGFLLPLVEFGGVEKVALQMARALRSYGWIPHAFVLDTSDISYTDDWSQVFESTSLLSDAAFRIGGGGTHDYLGNNVPDWAQNGNHSAVVGMLCWLDAVINFHGGAAVGVMGQLRRMGVTTLNSLHLSDLSTLGRPVGNTFLGLAYEHAFDFFVPCSHQLGDWLHAMGVPRAKIVPVPNAPGFELSPERVERSLIARGDRPEDAPLRVLYLGRLDRQKGLDRLTEVIRRTEEEALNIEWRVVGKAVMVEGAPAVAPELARYLEPSVTTPAELARLYDWADVVVLLSSYEGLPLTILEAMRQGCVPVATDVGAVSEALINGQTGVLLSSETAVPDCLDAMCQLSTNRDELLRLAIAGASCMQGRTWEGGVRSLVERLDKVAAKRMAAAVQDGSRPVQLDGEDATIVTQKFKFQEPVRKA